MSFMEPDIVFGDWYEIDGPMGTEYIPADLVGTITIECPASGEERFPIPSQLQAYCQNNEAWRLELITGYGARLSAPGYLDCTEWAVFETEDEAREYLRENYFSGE